MNPQLSIIIPIFNAEVFLEECLMSVIGQSFADMEIICIDDGSTDKSISILETFKGKDDRIHIIQQPNSGPSAARNAGIKASKGQFITFVDADDIVRNNIYTRTIGLMMEHNLDAIHFELESFPNGNRKTTSFPPNVIMDYGELFSSNQYIQTENALCFSHRFVFRSDVIKKNQIRFIDSVFYGEDMLFNIEAICHCQRIMIINEPLYMYRKNPFGAMSKKFKPKLEDSLLQGYKIKKQQIKKFNLDKDGSYTKDIAEYYIREFLPMLIVNEYNRPNNDNINKSIKRILSLKMMRESFDKIGFRNIFPTPKAYILYLAQKYKFVPLVRLAYDRVNKK